MGKDKRNLELFCQAGAEASSRNVRLANDFSVITPKLFSTWEKQFPGQLIELAAANDLRLFMDLILTGVTLALATKHAIVEQLRTLFSLVNRFDLRLVTELAATRHGLRGPG